MSTAPKRPQRELKPPVGAHCLHCGEPITLEEWERMAPFPAMQAEWHHECMFRCVAGSVAHQQGFCRCFGGDASDPPGMTKREAAKAALSYWHSVHPLVKAMPKCNL